MEKVNKVEVSSDGDYLKIKINDLLHLKQSLSTLLSIQSWREFNGVYCIEYTTTTKPTLSEYYDKNLWIDILKQLEEVDF